MFEYITGYQYLETRVQDLLDFKPVQVGVKQNPRNNRLEILSVCLQLSWDITVTHLKLHLNKYLTGWLEIVMEKKCA